MHAINKKALLTLTTITVLLTGGAFWYFTRPTTTKQEYSPPPQSWTEVSIEEDGIAFSFPPEWELSDCPQGVECPQDDTSIYLEAPFTYTEEDGQQSTYYLQIQNIPDEENRSVEELRETLKDATDSYDYYLTDNRQRYVKITLAPFNQDTPYPQQDTFKELSDQVVSTFILTANR